MKEQKKLEIAQELIQELRCRVEELRRLVAGAVPYVQRHNGDYPAIWMTEARAALDIPEGQVWNSEWPAICGNCGDEHTLGDIEVPWYHAKDLSNRLSIGQPLPAGECPKCRAWSYIKQEEPPQPPQEPEVEYLTDSGRPTKRPLGPGYTKE